MNIFNLENLDENFQPFALLKYFPDFDVYITEIQQYYISFIIHYI